MKKKDEAFQPSSCWNKAGNDELVFILLERDVAAPSAIRQWVAERIDMSKNERGDVQTTTALNIAQRMEDSQIAKGMREEGVK